MVDAERLNNGLRRADLVSVGMARPEDVGMEIGGSTAEGFIAVIKAAKLIKDEKQRDEFLLPVAERWARASGCCEEKVQEQAEDIYSLLTRILKRLDRK